MAKRIYLVRNSNGINRLIEADNKAVALSYAVRTTFTAELATQAQLVILVKEGIEVETIESEV